MLGQFKRGPRGHMAVNLLTRGAKSMRTMSVSRLIATAFLSKPPGASVVMHRNDDVTNNATKNLRWGTPAQNSADMVAKNRQARGERHGFAKLSSVRVLDIKARLARGDTKQSIAAAHGVSWTAIKDISTGRTWSHVSSGEH